MKINAKITNLMLGDGNVKAIASVNLDGCFAVKNLRVMSGKNGLFVSMPSIKDQDGSFNDICFPVTAEFRNQLTQTVIGAYHQAITQLQNQNYGQSSSQNNSGFAAPPQAPNQYDQQAPEYPGESFGYPSPAMM